MTTLSLRPYVSPLIHVLVWGLLGFLLLLYWPLSWQASGQFMLPIQFWIKQGILFCLLVGIFYLNAYVWVPRFLFQNRNGWFLVIALTASLALVFFVQQVDAWLNLPELIHKALHPDSNEPPRPRKVFDNYNFMLTLLVLGISTSVKAVQKWQKDAQLRLSLEQQKTSSELSFLKAQINPHFFFNTLNNIYILTTIDVEIARQALHRLSRMMRYVLYETQKDTTLLSQEVSFLQDYIELMQLRLTDKVEVIFESPPVLNDVLLAPMLFLPFVENAFKHGVSAQLPSRIHIAIHQQGPVLQLEVRNTKFNEKRMVLDESNGIGLTNTRRRLNLLYPHHYDLQVNEDKTENEYQVCLTLDLS